MLPLVLAALLGGGAVLAQPAAQEMPARAATDKNVHNYGEFYTSCVRWEDRCRICDRGTDGAPICSNIGIACQPAEISCIARQQPGEP